jgi:hypothetical protein
MSVLIRPFEPRLNIIKKDLLLWLDSSIQTSYNGGDTSIFPSTTFWNDLSGQGNNTDVLYEVNATDGVFDFNGTTDYARLPIGKLESFTNQLTVELWVSFESPIDYSCPIIKTTDNGWTDGWGIYFNAGSAYFFVNLYNGAQTVSTTVDSNLAHIVGVYNGANLKIYKNSTLIATSGSYTNNINNAVSYTYIGSGTTQYFSGKIPQVRVYNRGLTIDEVTHNYNTTKKRFGL